MDFLYKIEEFLNALILRIGNKLLSFVPPKVVVFFSHIDEKIAKLITFLKGLPAFLKSALPGLKSKALGFNYKETVVEPLKAGLAKYNAGKKEKAGQLKVLFLAPFLLFGQWLQGLSSAQALLLMFFTGASVISGISIISSGHRLVVGNDAGRAPASEEVSYDRPSYYKKETKQVTLTNFRLPVYIPSVNQVRSIDIDITATTSTREARMFLEKMEFQLRDHLINEIEPSVSSFPLTEEGKEIIRHKMKAEINSFLQFHKVNGFVEDTKVTYILAN